MTITARRAGSAAVAALLVLIALVIAIPSAHAATPPYEPDASSVGYLTFYNSAGTVITGGDITDSPIAAYVQGSVAPRSGDTKATLFGYLPVANENPGQWSGEALGASTTYSPLASGLPSSLASDTLPLETGAAGDHSIGDLETAFPNKATDDYAGLYQLRLVTSGAGESASTTYDSADIQVTGSTWTVVYPSTGATSTTTTLAVSPSSSSVSFGTKLTLTATVSPSAAAGSITFADGTTGLKTVAVTNGTASFSTTALKDGTHSLTATFTPTDSSSYGPSASTAHKVTVKATATKTTLTASKTSIKSGSKLTLTAKESPSASGKIEFRDGSKTIDSAPVKSGKASFTTSSLSKGTHKLTAKFVSNNTQAYSGSTSSTVKVTVTK